MLGILYDVLSVVNTQKFLYIALHKNVKYLYLCAWAHIETAKLQMARKNQLVYYTLSIALVCIVTEYEMNK